MPARPNVIIINCDDLGYGDLSCYGSKDHNTKTLDNMAEEGIRFTDFYMSASVCSPSRASLLTGCYHKRIGFSKFVRKDRDNDIVLRPGDEYGLNPDEVTIAQLLKNQGYSTIHIGKWHCGDQPVFLPTRFGFDNYYGIPFSNDMGVNSMEEEIVDNPWYDESMLNYPPLPLMDGEEVIQEQPDQASITERYLERAARFIRDNKDKPFFLYFAHMYVHNPIYVPQKFLNNSKNGPYGAAVEFIDLATAVIINELKSCGIDNNTLLIFTSDNGSDTIMGGSNKPLRGLKNTCWEGGFRVPCIMRWPDKIKAGTVSDEIVIAMDLFPTIASLAGARVPDDRVIDGKDISNILIDRPDKSKIRKTFLYYHRNNLYAVRDGDWKYFAESPDYPEALYNLKDDISESKDLKDKNKDIVRGMKKLLDKARDDLGDDLKGMEGKNTRPVGMVNNPKFITTFDPNHPYIMAEYDMNCIIGRLKECNID